VAAKNSALIKKNVEIDIAGVLVLKNTQKCWLKSPTQTSNFLFQICMEWKLRGHLCCFSWKCSKSQGNSIVV